MAIISLKTNSGRSIDVYRAYTPNASLSSTLRLPPSKFQVGINQTTTPTVGTTSLDYPVPIADGVVNDDGSNTFTGSSGASNSTDNTTTYKPGANVTDNTAQNLIKGDTNALAIWTISNLATAGINITSSKYLGLWLYIKDATALAKFKSTGTCLELKFGSDSSNYYSKTYTLTDLSTGWNWLGSNKTLLSALTETGTVESPIDTFIIEITTNNATDTFVAGDVVYDLLRTWDLADTLVSFDTGFPSINYTKNQATIEVTLTVSMANGFDLNAAAFWNEDTTPLLYSAHKYTAKSKTDTEEFKYQVRDLRV
jgi:hypothetical protein